MIVHVRDNCPKVRLLLAFDNRFNWAKYSPAGLLFVIREPSNQKVVLVPEVGTLFNLRDWGELPCDYVGHIFIDWVVKLNRGLLELDREN